MAGFDIMSILGGGDQSQADQPAPNPTAPPAADPAAEDGWKSYLTNPSVQAGLLSFGLSALAGGYGSTGQNLAYSVGQGAEAAGNSAETLRKEGQEDEAIADKKSDTAFNQDYKNRELAQRKDIANIAANTRMDIAQLRQGSGAKTLQEQKFFDTTYQKVYQSLNAQNTAALGVGSPAIFTDEEMQNVAQRQAQQALEAHRSQFSGSGLGQGAGMPDVGQSAPGTGTVPSQGVPGTGNSRPSTGNVGASQTGGQVAPEGTVVKLKDGSLQKKVNGVWVKQ